MSRTSSSTRGPQAPSKSRSTRRTIAASPVRASQPSSVSPRSASRTFGSAPRRISRSIVATKASRAGPDVSQARAHASQRAVRPVQSPMFSRSGLASRIVATAALSPFEAARWCGHRASASRAPSTTSTSPRAAAVARMRSKIWCRFGTTHMWQALLPEPSAIVGSAPSDSKRSTVVNRSFENGEMQRRAAARRLARVDADAVGALADLPLALGPQDVADHGVVAAGGRAGQGGGAARDHCVPVFPVSGLGCWPGAAAAEGGGHVGLLAFLLACSVLRAALLLAGAVPRESAVVWTGCPATGEAKLESNGRDVSVSANPSAFAKSPPWARFGGP